MAEFNCGFQLIDGEGKFDGLKLDSFVKNVKLSQCGVSYAVVAIMGPQSSGKSTLLNELFRTDFTTMNDQKRAQTTRGIWIAKCSGIDPCTIAMDLEGSDGRERGQDDTAFEKQIALFALAISDILLINMWHTDIGRNNAAGKPLLRAIFQGLMRLSVPGRKTVLQYVIRDTPAKANLDDLKFIIHEDLDMIWDEVLKPEEYKDTLFRKYFQVNIVALPYYELQRELFDKQVTKLRTIFFKSTSPGGFAEDRPNAIAGSDFSLSANNIWEQIKDNKDLNLPSHKVIVSNLRCDEIANEKFNQFISSKDWLELKAAVNDGPVNGFGKRLSSILNNCLSEYEKETKHYDDGVRKTRRDQLEKRGLDFVQPTYTTMIEHRRSEVFEHFKVSLKQLIDNGEQINVAARASTNSIMTKFDKGSADAAIKQAVNWDISKIRDALRSDMEAYTYSVVHDKILADMKAMNSKDQMAQQDFMEKMLTVYTRQLLLNEYQMEEIRQDFRNQRKGNCVIS